MPGDNRNRTPEREARPKPCIEAAGRFGIELGHHVTLIKDATAAFRQGAMHAAHAINGPNPGPPMHVL